MRRLYTSVGVQAPRRSESFRTRQICYHRSMKVEKEKFDSLLGKLLKAKPEPRKKIKTQGKRGPKPIIPPNS